MKPINPPEPAKQLASTPSTPPTSTPTPPTPTPTTPPANSLRAKLQGFFDSLAYQLGITALIIANAAVLGLATSAPLRASHGDALELADAVFLGIFTLELALKIFAFGRGFFTASGRGWNLFDLLIVLSGYLALGDLNIMRALRILRVLRLLSIIPSMRLVSGAMLAMLPSIFSISAILLMIYYIFAVLCCTLYAQALPQFFGSLGASFGTLFTLMALDGATQIIRTAAAAAPYSWVVLITFIFLSTFMTMNLIIGMLVSAIEDLRRENR